MNGERILVVHNAPSELQICAETLAVAGFQVHGVASNQDALDRLQEERFGLLLVDLTGSDGAGIALLTRAKALDPKLITIAMLGNGSWPQAIEVLRAGAWGFVAMPCDPGDFVLAVREALEARRQEQVLMHSRCPIPEIFQASLMGEDVRSRCAQLLNVVVRQIRADSAFILLLDDETESLQVVGSAGVPGDAVEHMQISLKHAAVEQALQQEEPWVVRDPSSLDPALRVLVSGPDVASTWFVPLRTSHRAIGMLTFSHVSGSMPLDPSKMKLLDIMSAQIAIGVQNARLFERVERLKTFNETIVQNMEEGILLEDAGGHVTFVNPKAADLLHCTPGDLVGQHWTSIVAPEHVAKVGEESAKRPEGISSRYETMLLTGEGQSVPVIAGACPLFDDGQFAGTLVVITDITELTQVTETLRESQHLLQTTFASLRDAVFILDTGAPEIVSSNEQWDDGQEPVQMAWRLGGGGKPASVDNVVPAPHPEAPRDPSIIDCNPAASEMFGYSRDEMLGRPTMFLHLDKASLQDFREQLFTAVENKGYLSHLEFRMKRKNGQVFFTEHSVVPLVDQEDRQFGWVSVVRDITKRKKTQDELRQRNEELIALNAIATTMNQTLDIDLMLDATLDRLLEVINIDGAWIQLLADDEPALSMVAQRGFSQGLLEETRSVRLDASLTGEVARTGQPIVLDKVSEDPRLGAEMVRQEDHHAFAGVPIKSHDRVLGVLGVFGRQPRTLSPLKIQILTSVGHQIGVALENVQLAQTATEMEMCREVDRMRAELIANVSHELRTPLGLIKLACSTLQRPDVDLDRQTQLEFLRDISEETDKLERIVGNLLNLSQAENGWLSLEKRLVDLGHLIGEVVEDMKVQFPHRQLVHDFPGTPLEVTADRERLEQVLRNLLSNAIKYSPEGGPITIRGHGDKERALISVTDQGIGIPAEDIEAVFDRFYRVENEVTQRVRGAGLGLAVCRDIVEAHGGRIWIESDLGKWTTCYLELPAEPD
ncbi:MAG: GAF domain-containing protein [Anaerolineae bacterium]